MHITNLLMPYELFAYTIVYSAPLQEKKVQML